MLVTTTADAGLVVIVDFSELFFILFPDQVQLLPVQNSALLSVDVDEHDLACLFFFSHVVVPAVQVDPVPKALEVPVEVVISADFLHLLAAHIVEPDQAILFPQVHVLVPVVDDFASAVQSHNVVHDLLWNLRGRQLVSSEMLAHPDSYVGGLTALYYLVLDFLLFFLDLLLAHLLDLGRVQNYHSPRLHVPHHQHTVISLPHLLVLLPLEVVAVHHLHLLRPFYLHYLLLHSVTHKTSSVRQNLLTPDLPVIFFFLLFYLSDWLYLSSLFLVSVNVSPLRVIDLPSPIDVDPREGVEVSALFFREGVALVGSFRSEDVVPCLRVDFIEIQSLPDGYLLSFIFILLFSQPRISVGVFLPVTGVGAPSDAGLRPELAHRPDLTF